MPVMGNLPLWFKKHLRPEIVRFPALGVSKLFIAASEGEAELLLLLLYCTKAKFCVASPAEISLSKDWVT